MAWGCDDKIGANPAVKSAASADTTTTGAPSDPVRADGVVVKIKPGETEEPKGVKGKTVVCREIELPAGSIAEVTRGDAKNFMDQMALKKTVMCGIWEKSQKSGPKSAETDEFITSFTKREQKKINQILHLIRPDLRELFDRYDISSSFLPDGSGLQLEDVKKNKRTGFYEFFLSVRSNPNGIMDGEGALVRLRSPAFITDLEKLVRELLKTPNVHCEDTSSRVRAIITIRVKK